MVSVFNRCVCLPLFASFSLLATLLVTHEIKAQSTFLPSNHHWHYFIERMEIKGAESGSQFHAALKPLERRAMVDFLMEKDSVLPALGRTDRAVIQQILAGNREWKVNHSDTATQSTRNYFFKNPPDVFHHEEEGFFLVINPVIHFTLGHENDRDMWLYQNTRGLELRGMISDKVGFYTFLADNQARFPSYVNEKIAAQSGAIPGEGWNIPFGVQGYDFFTARGHIAFSATRNISFQFGQDRNFIGFGQRSLILSDFSNNYLFLKINTKVWRIHYQNIFARLVDFPLRTFGGRMFDPKYMAAHTLSMNLTPRFQLGLFENVVFGRSDTISPRGFDAHYLNPVIFYRAVEHHIGDPDKIALGAFWRWITRFNVALYGQLYIDDFHVGDLKYDIDTLLVRAGLRNNRKYDQHASFRNKFAFQKGIHWIDVAGISNLDLKLEGNWVRPFVYSHYDVDGSGLRPAASYSHYSQPLAHPLGANFRELFLRIFYMPHHNWHLTGSFFTAKQGRDMPGTNMGSNIFRDYTSRTGDYGHTFLQGLPFTVQMLQMEAAWHWRYNLWLEAKYVNRVEQNDGVEKNNHLIFFGIRMNVTKREAFF